MDKEFAGQPLWLWLLGAGVVVVGVIWFKSHGASSQQSPAQTGGTGKSMSTSSFKEFITQHQMPSTTHKKKAA